MKMSVAELSNYFETKYAKKKDTRSCTCEHCMCDELMHHLPGKCRNVNFIKGYMCPTGYLCDVCGQYYSEKDLTNPKEDDSELNQEE